MEKKKKKLDVVIPAAGVGKRMRADIPKQYLKLGNKTILERTVDVFLQMESCIADIIIAIGEQDGYFSELNLTANPRVKVCYGGKERLNSVLNGLKTASSEYVLVHDAARPCVQPDDIEKLISEACNEHGGILVSRVADTMKRTDADGRITETVSRDKLFHALTPQLFNRQKLIHAYEKAIAQNLVLTDEASAMEQDGYMPKAVLGAASNIKITEPFDIQLAEFFLKLQNRW